MKVILKEDVVSLGIEGDVLNVADGYGRNYLIPKGLAVLATKGTLKDLEFRRKAIAKKEVKRVEDAKAYAKKFEGKKLKINVRVAEEGKLYGSVNVSDVAALIKEQLNEDIDKRLIVLSDQIKTVGSYKVTLRVHPEVEAHLDLEVTGEEVTPAKETPAKEESTGEEISE